MLPDTLPGRVPGLLFRMSRERTYRYFAYGSNLSTERLRARVPSARARGRGRLPHHAFTYHANPARIDAALRPFDWYKDYVVRGAREHGLPADYIRELEVVGT